MEDKERYEQQVRMEVFKAALGHHAGQTVVADTIIEFCTKIAGFVIGKPEEEKA